MHNIDNYSSAELHDMNERLLFFSCVTINTEGWSQGIKFCFLLGVTIYVHGFGCHGLSL